MSERSEVKLRSSGVRAPSSPGNGKRLSESQFRIYNQPGIDFGHVDRKVFIKIAVKAMSETIDEHNIVPSRVVSGVTSRVPIRKQNFRNKKNE